MGIKSYLEEVFRGAGELHGWKALDINHLVNEMADLLENSDLDLDDIRDYVEELNREGLYEKDDINAWLYAVIDLKAREFKKVLSEMFPQLADKINEYDERIYGSYMEMGYDSEFANYYLSDIKNDKSQAVQLVKDMLGEKYSEEELIEMMNGIGKIVSHKEPRHLDDYLAIAKTKNEYPFAKVEYVAPQAVPEEYKEDDRVALIDVGGEYDPMYMNFDHHQDKNLPSSIVLILQEFDLPTDARLIKEIDTIDRFGYKKAMEELGLKPNKEIDELRRIILMANLDDPNVAQTISEVLDKYITEKKDVGLDDFIKELHQVLLEKGMLKDAYKKIEEEKKQFEENLKNASLYEANGYKIAFTTNSFSPRTGDAFKELGADIIIERNTQNPNHTSIIKNTANENTKDIDLNKVFLNDDEKVFIHPTGFIAVMNMPIENVNVNGLIERLGLKKEMEENQKQTQSKGMSR